MCECRPCFENLGPDKVGYSAVSSAVGTCCVASMIVQRNDCMTQRPSRRAGGSPTAQGIHSIALYDIHTSIAFFPSWAGRIHSTPLHPVSVSFVSIMTFHMLPPSNELRTQSKSSRWLEQPASAFSESLYSSPLVICNVWGKGTGNIQKKIIIQC